MGIEFSAEVVVPVLFVVTLGAVIGFALMSKKRTEERMQDGQATKSTLAEDTPNKR